MPSNWFNDGPLTHVQYEIDCKNNLNFHHPCIHAACNVTLQLFSLRSSQSFHYGLALWLGVANRRQQKSWYANSKSRPQVVVWISTISHKTMPLTWEKSGLNCGRIRHTWRWTSCSSYSHCRTASRPLHKHLERSEETSRTNYLAADFRCISEPSWD